MIQGLFHFLYQDGGAGRKVDVEREVLFCRLCSWLESELEEGVLTLNDVYIRYIGLDESPDKSVVYSKRYLKEKLIAKYKESLYFTSQERRTDILCFKDQTNNILRQHHKHLQQTDDEKTLIIKTALKFICNDMKVANLNRDVYPSVQSMADTQHQLNSVPDSLKLFLKPIVKTDRKVAVWGQNFIKAYRPRSGVAPFQMGLALQVEHRYGSKWLLNRLHGLGYTESYKEVHNYKYCYLKMKQNYSTTLETVNEEVEENDELDVDTELFNNEGNDCGMPETSQECPVPTVSETNTVSETTTSDNNVSQYVADNMDMNIVSIYGNTGFHVMGMIGLNSSSIAPPENKSFERTRLSAHDKANLLNKDKVDIPHFIDCKSKGIETKSFIPLDDLKASVSHGQPCTISGDVLWALGWVIKGLQPDFQHCNWNGWMKQIHKDHAKKVTDITFLPVIEGYPNEKGTVLATLQECLRLSNGKPAIITFDLPLWLKALDVSIQKKLPVLPRLGGFHTLKSFLGSIGNIMEDSGLHELIRLVYAGSTTAEHIMQGGCYDKAIRSHLLIDAALVEHVMRDEFSSDELLEIKNTIKTVSDEKLGSDYQSPFLTQIIARFNQKFEKLSDGGRTPALWVQYHKMVDTIKIFIRAERVADWKSHLYCIATRMLDTYAAAGHHQYAKGARMYVQTMKEFETDPDFKDTLQNYSDNGDHVVRYSDQEWSGTWTDMSIEQKLMKPSKSLGGMDRGRMKNSESGHRVWLETLNHMTSINLLMEEHADEDSSQQSDIHKDLGPTRMQRDAEAVAHIGTWFDSRKPFDQDRDRALLVSFSTGFTSTEGADDVNADQAMKVGEQMNTILNNKKFGSSMELKAKVHPLSILRKAPLLNDVKVHVQPLKLFNRLIIIVQRFDSVQESLKYELTLIPLSLFDNNHKMRKANKAEFSKACLKSLTTASSSCPTVSHIVIDGGWLLHMVKWEQGDTWQDIADRYLKFVLNLVATVSHRECVTVVFDGTLHSTKDHEHVRRTKHLCGNLTIKLDMIHLVGREKFLDNKLNKSWLIKFVSDKLDTHAINVIQCRDDADTDIVKETLSASRKGPVEVRVEDTDVLAMLLYHVTEDCNNIFMTTSGGTYNIQHIHDRLSPLKLKYLLVCHAFTGCDTVSSIMGHGKSTLVDKLCGGSMNRHLDVFLSSDSTKDEIIKAGILLFQFTYNAPGVTLAQTRYHMFSKKAAAGIISPEYLPPTEGAAAQHSLRTYLQTQDWLSLKSMSRDAEEYGFKFGDHGYEPITTLDEWAPSQLRNLTRCNCQAPCDTKRCSCVKNEVSCISACGYCKGVTCKNALQ